METLLSVVQDPEFTLVRYCNVNAGSLTGQVRFSRLPWRVQLRIASENIMPLTGWTMLLMRASSIKPRKLFAMGERPARFPMARTVEVTGRLWAVAAVP